MTGTYSYHAGSTPPLISVPHDARFLPESVGRRMTAAGTDISDTGWHVAKLYEFVSELDASLLVADYSRYVVDLNRPPDDAALYAGQISTGICPSKSFAGEYLYEDRGVVAAQEVRERVDTYWLPYHSLIESTLTALRDRYGYAILWDAHSIPSLVPRLFDGELPVLNIGTNNGDSCSASIAEQVFEIAASSDYSAVMNARFKGGYITRPTQSPACAHRPR